MIFSDLFFADYVHISQKKNHKNVTSITLKIPFFDLYLKKYNCQQINKAGQKWLI